MGKRLKTATATHHPPRAFYIKHRPVVLTMGSTLEQQELPFASAEKTIILSKKDE